MDIRIEKTERAIRNAFWELRSQKPLEKITIKELCAKAYINKSTFYAHYPDIFALSGALEEETISSILESILPDHDYSLKNAEVFTRNLCMAFFAHRSLIRVLFSDGNLNTLGNRIEKALKEMIFRKYPFFASDLEKNILLSFFIQGAYHALLDHLDTDYDTAVDIISEMIKKISEFTNIFEA